MRGLRGLLAATAVLIVAPAGSVLGAQGQRITELTTAGFAANVLTVTNTTVTDFEAGAVAIGTSTFTVDLTRNQGAGGFSPRVTTVNVSCAAPCPASGTLASTGLQWRRADLGTWNSISTTPQLVESRTVTFNGTNDPWSNTLFWRYALSWTGTPPTAATTFHIRFDIVVTAP